MIKVAIVEDRPLVSKLLEALIHAHEELQLINSSDTVEKAIKFLNTATVDLVLMDIELPDGTGFDILSKISNKNFKVIFVTDHQNYAIEAFKYNAIDYLLKPIDTENFYQSINKALESFKKENQEIQLQTLLNNINFSLQETQKIILNTSDNLHVVEIKNIVRCESEDSYTKFFMNNNKMIMTAKSLKIYEEILAKHSFVRTHKSHLINLNHLDNFDKRNNSVYLSDATKIPVSVRRKEGFVSTLKDFFK